MDGFVNVLKAPGMTSSNVVCDVRRIFSEKHAGHLGTLDPGAAGVLPVALGRAAKLFDLLVDKEKTYLFEITFGVATDTLDSYGRVTERQDCDVKQADILPVLPDFLGRQLQRAPAYSALKVDGKKLYDLARAGEEIPDRLREIFVRELKLLEQTGKNRFLFSMTCSRGTYVRVIAEDMGRRLSLPACVTLLLREASGPFKAERAYSLQELTERKEAGALQDVIISCKEALAFLPEIRLPEDRVRAAMNGLSTDNRREQNGFYRLYGQKFLGLGQVEGGSLRLKVHLY